MDHFVTSDLYQGRCNQFVTSFMLQMFSLFVREFGATQKLNIN